MLRPRPRRGRPPLRARVRWARLGCLAALAAAAALGLRARAQRQRAEVLEERVVSLQRRLAQVCDPRRAVIEDYEPTDDGVFLKLDGRWRCYLLLDRLARYELACLGEHEPDPSPATKGALPRGAGAAEQRSGPRDPPGQARAP